MSEELVKREVAVGLLPVIACDIQLIVGRYYRWSIKDQEGASTVTYVIKEATFEDYKAFHPDLTVANLARIKARYPWYYFVRSD